MEEKNDVIRNSLIALSAAIPYAGGTLSFLLDKYIPSETERRRNEYLKMLEEDLNELKDKIDISNLDTPEFRSVFRRLLREAIEEYKEEKLTAFRNLTINIAIDPYKFNKIDFYMRMVISLVPDEIMILRIFYLLDVKEELRMYDDKPEKRDIYEIIEKVYHWSDKEYLQALMTDMLRYRLILANNDISKTMIKDGLFLSDLGKDFARYIFEPKEGKLYGFF